MGMGGEGRGWEGRGGRKEEGRGRGKEGETQERGMFNGGMYHSQVTSAVQVTVTYLQGTTLRLSTTHPIHIGYIGATLCRVCAGLVRGQECQSHYTTLR